MNAQKIITGKELRCLIYPERGAIESFEVSSPNQRITRRSIRILKS